MFRAQFQAFEYNDVATSTYLMVAEFLRFQLPLLKKTGENCNVVTAVLQEDYIATTFKAE